MDDNAWTSASRQRSNLIALTTTALLMLCLFVLDHEPVERLALVRRTALFMVVTHTTFHGISLLALWSMVRRGVENAELALAFYRHPRRLSHLDLAVGWIGLFAAAPYLV